MLDSTTIALSTAKSNRGPTLRHGGGRGSTRGHRSFLEGCERSTIDHTLTVPASTTTRPTQSYTTMRDLAVGGPGTANPTAAVAPLDALTFRGTFVKSCLGIQ